MTNTELMWFISAGSHAIINHVTLNTLILVCCLALQTFLILNVTVRIRRALVHFLTAMQMGEESAGRQDTEEMDVLKEAIRILE